MGHNYTDTHTARRILPIGRRTWRSSGVRVGSYERAAAAARLVNVLACALFYIVMYLGTAPEN